MKELGVAFRQELYDLLKTCLASPVELGGDSWVLEELKKTLRKAKSGKFKKEEAHLAEPWNSIMDLILEEIGCLESQAPVALKEKLKGNSWVLEKLKQTINTISPTDYFRNHILQKIKDLESQAPVSEIAKQETLDNIAEEEFEKFADFIKQEFGREVVDKMVGEGWINVVIDLLKQAKEDRRKARAWDRAEILLSPREKYMIEELLSQEESDEQKP